MTRVRRYTRGASALFGVLLLAALAGAALTLHYETRAHARGQALDRAAGQIFAAWFHAAHRASLEHAADFTARLETGDAIILTPARLRTLGLAPPGLPDAPGRYAAFTLGIIADGTALAVPMAFGVLEPAADGGAAHGTALRQGALGAGLAALDQPGGGALMAPHLPAIAATLGRPPGAEAFYVTADHGLRYLENALYRRAQPGRAYLNRMETGLDMSSGDPDDPAGKNVSGAGAITARAATIAGASEVGGNITVDDAVMAQRLTAADLSAREIGGARLTVSADLVVGHAVTGTATADSVNATGRLDAGGLRTAGALGGQVLSTATSVAVAGTAAVTGRLDGEQASVAGTLQAGAIAAQAAHGPEARIDGTMTVGSCGGC